MSHFWLSYRNHFSSMQRTLRKRKKEKEEGLFKRNMQTAANTKLCKLQMNFLHFANWYMKSSNCFLIGYGLLPLLLQTPEHLFLDEQTLAFFQFFIVQWWFATTTGHSSWRVKLAEINFFQTNGTESILKLTTHWTFFPRAILAVQGQILNPWRITQKLCLFIFDLKPYRRRKK